MILSNVLPWNAECFELKDTGKPQKQALPDPALIPSILPELSHENQNPFFHGGS
jgi:hypothetical protein